MRILFITNLFSPFTTDSGASQRSRHICSALSQFGSVDVISVIKEGQQLKQKRPIDGVKDFGEIYIKERNTNEEICIKNLKYIQK